MGDYRALPYISSPGLAASPLGFNAVNQLTSKGLSNALYQWIGRTRDHDYVVNGLNQYTRIRGTSISYDASGNLTSDGVWNYSYDVENMLVAASRPGMSASFLYDPLGRRSAKTANGASTTFLHDGVEEIADYDASGTLLRRYVHGPGVDEYLVMYVGSGTANKSYYHANHQGGIVALSDGNGNVTETHAYSPYGMGEGDDTGNPFRYTGRRLDAETGLYYYRSRYMSPAIGRFLQTDPIGYGDGLNWYTYVGNDPVNNTDPSGNCPWCIVGAIIGGGAEYLRQKAAGEEISLGKIAVSAAAGALTGGVGAASTALTSVAGRTAVNAVAGAAANIGNEVGKNAIDGKTTSAGDVANAGLQGAAFGAAGSVAGDGLQAAGKGISNAMSSSAKNASAGTKNLASGIVETTASAGGPGGSAPVSGGAIAGNVTSNAFGNSDLVNTVANEVKCMGQSNEC